MVDQTDVIDKEASKINLQVLLTYILLNYGPFDFDIMAALKTFGTDYELVLEEDPENPGHLTVDVREAQAPSDD